MKIRSLTAQVSLTINGVPGHDKTLRRCYQMKIFVFLSPNRRVSVFDDYSRYTAHIHWWYVPIRRDLFNDT